MKILAYIYIHSKYNILTLYLLNDIYVCVVYILSVVNSLIFTHILVRSSIEIHVKIEIHIQIHQLQEYRLFLFTASCSLFGVP